MKSYFRMIFLFIVVFVTSCAAPAKKTPSLSDFNDTTPVNQDAMNKLEAGTTY